MMTTDRPTHTLSPFRRNTSTFGRNDGIRFRKLQSECAGEQSIGAVQVDCRHLCQLSKLGFTGTGSEKDPAGVIYMSFEITQPNHCRLSWASIEVKLESHQEQPESLDEVQPVRRQSRGPLELPLEVRDWAPKNLTGEKQETTVQTSASVTPSLQFPTGGFSGVGVNRTKAATYVRRWTFDGSPMRGPRGSSYQGVKWTLTENKLDKYSRNNRKFFTAFTFAYDGQPLVMGVHIHGRLESTSRRLKQKGKEALQKRFMFGPRNDRPEGLGKTIIRGSPREQWRLDRLTDGLEEKMIEWNRCGGVPSEIHDAQSSVPPGGDTEQLNDGTAKLAEDGRLFPSTPNNHTNAPAHSLDPLGWIPRPHIIQIQVPVQQSAPTNPTIQNLLNAQNTYFPRQISRSIVRKGAEMPPPGRVMEEESEEGENEEVQNNQSKSEKAIHGYQVDQEMVAKVLRITVVRLIFQVLAGLLDLVS